MSRQGHLNAYTAVLTILILLCIAGTAMANDEVKCYVTYEKMTQSIEDAASASNAGDSCRAADGIESALNWGGSALEYCRGDLRVRIRQNMSVLTGALVEYVKKCGH